MKRFGAKLNLTLCSFADMLWQTWKPPSNAQSPAGAFALDVHPPQQSNRPRLARNLYMGELIANLRQAWVFRCRCALFFEQTAQHPCGLFVLSHAADHQIGGDLVFGFGGSHKHGVRGAGDLFLISQ